MGKRGTKELVLPEKTRNKIQQMYFDENQRQIDIAKILDISKYDVIKAIDQRRYNCNNSSELSLRYLNGRGFTSWWQYHKFLESKDDYRECFRKTKGQLKDHGYDVRITEHKGGFLGIKFLEEIGEDNGFIVGVFRECLNNARNFVGELGFPVKGNLEFIYNQNINPRLNIRPRGLKVRAFLSAYGDVLKG